MSWYCEMIRLHMQASHSEQVQDLTQRLACKDKDLAAARQQLDKAQLVSAAHTPSFCRMAPA